SKASGGAGASCSTTGSRYAMTRTRAPSTNAKPAVITYLPRTWLPRMTSKAAVARIALPACWTRAGTGCSDDCRRATCPRPALGPIDQCQACRHPVSAEDMASPQYEQGVSCPHCYDSLPEKTRRRAEERQRQIELAKRRNQPHPIGLAPELASPNAR